MLDFISNLPSNIQFIASMLLLTVAFLLWKKPFKQWPEYFKTKDGLGILKGVVMVVGIGSAIAAVSAFADEPYRGNWLKDASIYAGLDVTGKTSPQCVSGSADDVTSNVGAKLNLYESNDGKFRANTKYTHHSCAFGSDRNSYDAIGVELEYKIWER